MRSYFSKNDFIFDAGESKPSDYRYLSSFAQSADSLRLDRNMVRIMEKALIKTVVSPPPSEQSVGLESVLIFEGAKRFVNTVFCSRLSGSGKLSSFLVSKFMFRTN